MDKNTIIGFSLIVALLVGYSWFTKPSEEQIKAQQAYNDSIRQVQAEQAAIREMEFAQAQAYADSINNDKPAADYGAFNPLTVGQEQYYTLENDSLLVTLSNKGGSIVSVQLKGYLTSDKEPLVLFDQNDAKTQFTLVTNNNRIVESGNLYFTATQVNDSSITMALQMDSTSALYLHYNLGKNAYLVNMSMEAMGMDKYLSPQMTSLDWSWDMKIRKQER
ncbi:MAG: YidC/Oxa1 family insertase periplasmic-domain containing protein, partial [Paludibacteraceae bacterium]|nr:YidC/Oxa1 family insertase periplasmic-domain containing protein [Paludibacteraceae bacterium]